MHCTKISPEFECQGQRSKVKVTGDKKRKSAAIVWELSSGARSSSGIFFGSGPRGVGPLRRWENQLMLSIVVT